LSTRANDLHRPIDAHRASPGESVGPEAAASSKWGLDRTNPTARRGDALTVTPPAMTSSCWRYMVLTWGCATLLVSSRARSASVFHPASTPGKASSRLTGSPSTYTVRPVARIVRTDRCAQRRAASYRCLSAHAFGAESTTSVTTLSAYALPRPRGINRCQRLMPTQRNAASQWLRSLPVHSRAIKWCRSHTAAGSRPLTSFSVAGLISPCW
jgi:hypothetical protein